MTTFVHSKNFCNIGFLCQSSFYEVSQKKDALIEKEFNLPKVGGGT